MHGGRFGMNHNHGGALWTAECSRRAAARPAAEPARRPPAASGRRPARRAAADAARFHGSGAKAASGTEKSSGFERHNAGPASGRRGRWRERLEDEPIVEVNSGRVVGARTKFITVGRPLESDRFAADAHGRTTSPVAGDIAFPMAPPAGGVTRLTPSRSSRIPWKPSGVR